MKTELIRFTPVQPASAKVKVMMMIIIVAALIYAMDNVHPTSPQGAPFTSWDGK